jgi:inner membrane protein
MDSVTQIALGAAVSEAVMANKVGRKASLWGAILGTLPDLDVLIPMGDAVRDFTYHRAASHSLFFMTLAAPLILWLILRIHPSTAKYKFRWFTLIILTLFTHAILDSFTVYGTQMYLPFSNYPVGWSTIFVIDPLYTLPLLAGVLSFFVLKKSPSLALKLNIAGIIISSIYLLWTVVIKINIDSKAMQSLSRQNINAETILSSPSPFNSVLWRIVAKTENGYAEGFYSIFDKSDEIRFRKYQSKDELLSSIADEWSVERLKWFSKGLYKVDERENKIIISDLRMGVEPLYFFSFIVGERKGEMIFPAENVEKFENTEFKMSESIKMLWKRIWDEDVDRVFVTNRNGPELLFK